MEYLKPEPRLRRQEALKLADDEFSLLMRAYHADGGFVRCGTCGQEMPWKGTGWAHWGHYIDRQYMWTRWDVTNGAVQCETCNCYGGGETERMRAHLVKKHGEEEVERLEIEHKRLLRITIEEIVELADTFRKKREEIEQEKRL